MGVHLNLLGHELVHLLLTAVIAGFLYWRFRDWKLIIACFLLSIFIDVDHLFDYFAYFGPKINLSSFFDVTSYIEPANKIYVLLHGWEFVIPFWLIGRWVGKKFKVNGSEWAISLTYLGHLFWDNFSFSHHPFAYFFIYRLVNSFSLEKFNAP